jgi:hypothetical protein
LGLLTGPGDIDTWTIISAMGQTMSSCFEGHADKQHSVTASKQEPLEPEQELECGEEDRIGTSVEPTDAQIDEGQIVPLEADEAGRIEDLNEAEDGTEDAPAEEAVITEDAIVVEEVAACEEPSKLEQTNQSDRLGSAEVATQEDLHSAPAVDELRKVRASRQIQLP